MGPNMASSISSHIPKGLVSLVTIWTLAVLTMFIFSTPEPTSNITRANVNYDALNDELHAWRERVEQLERKLEHLQEMASNDHTRAKNKIQLVQQGALEKHAGNEVKEDGGRDEVQVISDRHGDRVVISQPKVQMKFGSPPPAPQVAAPKPPPAPLGNAPPSTKIGAVKIDETTGIWFMNSWFVYEINTAAVLLAVPTEEIAKNLTCSDIYPLSKAQQEMDMINVPLYSIHDKWEKQLLVLLRCPVRNKIAGTGERNVFVKHLETEYKLVAQPPTEGKYKVGSCVAQLRGDVAWQIPEWIEYHRRLGVEHFTVYVAHNAPNVLTKTLNYYSAQGLMEVIVWDKDTSELTHYYNQVPTFNDCMYRNRNRYAYTTFHDIDEYIKFFKQEDGSARNDQPKNMEELVSMDKPGYIFTESTFRAECLAPEKTRTHHLLLDATLQRHSGNPPKTVLKTQLGIMMGVHQPYHPKDGLVYMSDKNALLYHFRNISHHLKEHPCDPEKDQAAKAGDSHTFLNTALVEDGQAVKESVDVAWRVIKGQ